MDMAYKMIAVAAVCFVVYLHQIKGVWMRGVSPPHFGVLVSGDPDAVERSFIDSFNPWATWRKQWKWILLEVDSRSRYVMHYRSGDRHEEFSRALNTSYVAVRVGRGDVHFWATQSGVGGAEFAVPITEASDLLLREALELFCGAAGIDCTKDVTWI
jgi:hypothetical protein